MVKEHTLDGEWRLLDLSYASVFQNLALEEALARCSASEPRSTVRIWVDPRAVVVGRFQDVQTEVDVDLCQQNNIQIARRFTGGGAVFHDEGNLNLTIVTSRLRETSLIRFHEINCSVILNLFDQLGLEGNFVPPNSIEISGKKVSGAAAALGRDFALWHASILVSTHEHMLNRLLLPSRETRASNFIRSKWQPVTTLESALGTHVSLEEAKRRLVSSCERCYGVKLESGQLHADEEQLMTSLYVRRYSSPEWNLRGYQSQRKDG
jgi:lipoate-protein ligase A